MKRRDEETRQPGPADTDVSEPDSGEPTQSMPAVVDDEPDTDTETPPTPHYLVADRLSAGPRRGRLFTNVSLRARLGDLVAVLGDAGSGRTSLLLALAGRFACASGTIAIDGQTRPSRLRRKVAVARAGPVVAGDPHHTVGALVGETVLVSGGHCDAESIRRIGDLLGVRADDADTFGRLPVADRTLLMVAFAAALRTPVIVVDDVDMGVDACGAARVWTALRRLADRNHLIIASAVRPDLTPDVVVRMRQPDPNIRPRAWHDATAVVTRVVEGNTP